MLASHDMHASSYFILARPRPASLGAGRGREYEISIARAWIILRGCICACVLAIDMGFVTMPRVLHVCA